MVAARMLLTSGKCGSQCEGSRCIVGGHPVRPGRHPSRELEMQQTLVSPQLNPCTAAVTTTRGGRLNYRPQGLCYATDVVLRPGTGSGTIDWRNSEQKQQKQKERHDPSTPQMALHHARSAVDPSCS